MGQEQGKALTKESNESDPIKDQKKKLSFSR